MVTTTDIYDSRRTAYVPKEIIGYIEVTIYYKDGTAVRPAIFKDGELTLV